MSKEHCIEELCDCDYEVEINTNWSDFDPGRDFVACPFYMVDGLGCTYLVDEPLFSIKSESITKFR